MLHVEELLMVTDCTGTTLSLVQEDRKLALTVVDQDGNGASFDITHDQASAIMNALLDYMESIQ
jgi:hypothetical protein